MGLNIEISTPTDWFASNPISFLICDKFFDLGALLALYKHKQMQDLSQEEVSAISTIKEACRRIAHEMMTLQPAIGKLTEESVRSGLYETIYQLTAQVESVKKQVIRYEKGDASKIL